MNDQNLEFGCFCWRENIKYLKMNDEFAWCDFELFDINDDELLSVSNELSSEIFPISTNDCDLRLQLTSDSSPSSFTSVEHKNTSKYPIARKLPRDTNEQEPAKKKPKKQYYVKVNAVPRILKRDIRRDYGKMLANVFNSAEFTMIDSFLKYICKPECQIMKYRRIVPLSSSSLTKRMPEPTHNKILECGETLAGFIYHSYLIGNSFPDFVMKVTEVNISQMEGLAGSRVILEVEFHGTKPRSYQPMLDTLRNPFVCPYCTDTDECDWSRKYHRMPYDYATIRKPQIIFCLDELHRANNIEFVILEKDWKRMCQQTC